MIRLTILLLGVIGVTMAVAGRNSGTGVVADAGTSAEAPAGTDVAATRGASDQVLALAPGAAPKTGSTEVIPARAAPSDDQLIDPPGSPAPAADVALADPAPSADPPPADQLVASDQVAAAEPAPALEDPASVEDEIAAAITAAQVRYVSATKVNVRTGPSTDFAVVDQVVLGDAIELMSESQDGWVRIRIQGDGVEGYIAERFLTETEPNG